MNRTNIEWVKNPDGSQGSTTNPITGCLNHDNGLCKGGGFPCYACKLANTRLKKRYLANTNLAPDAKGGVATLSISGQKATEREGDYADPFYPRFWEERLNWHRLYSVDEYITRGIFVCDMADLFGIGIPEDWTRKVLDYIRTEFEERFYLLTKQPQNLIKFSPFPDNAWVGVTATGLQMFNRAMFNLQQIEAKVKYISFEPLLEQTNMTPGVLTLFGKPIIDWLIIGACTGTKKDMEELCKRYPDLTLMPWGKKWTAQPRIEWVSEIVEAADKAAIPVFLKNNLWSLLVDFPGIPPVWARGRNGQDADILRQEIPE